MTSTLHPKVQAAHLQQAFHWIAEQRASDPARALEAVIEAAAVRFALSPEQTSWVRWTLSPDAVAVQPKEPDPSRR